MDGSCKILYENDLHKCVMFSFDDETHEDSFLSVNQYLVVDNGVGILLDPGSDVAFDELYDAVSEHIKISNIKYIFLSHQDPDVSGSIARWSISANAKFILSSLWARFMSHYGFMQTDRMILLNDKGATLKFGKSSLHFIPAHFLHSPGNFSLYDETSKILFSGDIGAAIVGAPNQYKIVDDFLKHKEYLQGFHERYMGSNKACKTWVNIVEKLDIDMIAPQHGFLFDGKNTALFLAWLKELKCGSDILGTL